MKDVSPSFSRLVLLLAAGLLVGCRGPGLFEDVAEKHGLEFTSYAGDHLWYILDTMGSGLAAGDYDGDGDEDLFLATGGALLDEYQEEALEYSNALWRNDGGGKFTDVTEGAGLKLSGWSNGALFADYDGDGDLDLFVTRHGPNVLYQNQGNGTFRNVAREAGVDHAGWGAGAAFGDFDGDGDLDLYVANYAHFDPQTQKGKVDWFDKGVQQFPQYFEPEDNVFYLNNGNGTFTDATREWGAQGTGRSLGVLAADFDDDGDLDLYVANDVGFNNLLVNQGGKFQEVALDAGVAGNRNGEFEASMGVATGDYDGDGDLDIIVTNYAGEANTLYRNEGLGIFTDATSEARLVGQRILDSVGWGVGLHDFDLDGNLDLFVVNGHVVTGVVLWYMRHFYSATKDDIRQMGPAAFNGSSAQSKLFFLGDGKGAFEDGTDRAGYEVTSPRLGRGAAFADFDGDGRMDVAVSNKNELAQVILNRMPPRGNWTQISLRWRAPNFDAIGSRVIIEAGGRRILRVVNAGTSYLSGDQLTVHAGVGPATRLDRVEVRWPDGEVQTFQDLPVNQKLTLSRKDPAQPQAPGAEVSGKVSSARP